LLKCQLTRHPIFAEYFPATLQKIAQKRVKITE